MLREFRNSNFFIQLSNWEFWPASIANIPLLLFWAWFALRSRSPLFFSAANPVIETGGLWGESKFHILQRIPKSHLPLTLFIPAGSTAAEALGKMQAAGLGFPIIAKPNVGERGFLVAKIESTQALADYVARHPVDFLIQEFIDLPMELAVLYHRFPDSRRGQVTSVCLKETLRVTGDGHRSVAELMQLSPRARLQADRFEKNFPELMRHIPADREILELEPIGNHSRGTCFLNGNHLIDERLNAAFDRVALQMEGIHYGRFDLKCLSMEDIKDNGNFIVMEFNGVGGEPAHIYDPSYPVWKKYRDFYRHWRIIYRIHREQARCGIKSMGLGEAIDSLRTYFNYKKHVENFAAAASGQPRPAAHRPQSTPAST